MALQTVALGYSEFCELFTQEEWKGYDYFVGKLNESLPHIQLT